MNTCLCFSIESLPRASVSCTQHFLVPFSLPRISILPRKKPKVTSLNLCQIRPLLTKLLLVAFYFAQQQSQNHYHGSQWQQGSWTSAQAPAKEDSRFRHGLQQQHGPSIPMVSGGSTGHSDESGPLWQYESRISTQTPATVGPRTSRQPLVATWTQTSSS